MRSGISVRRVAGIMIREGAPLDHVEIAKRAKATKHQISSLLAYMRKRGLVFKIPSMPGRDPKSFTWSLTEKAVTEYRDE